MRRMQEDCHGENWGFGVGGSGLGVRGWGLGIGIARATLRYGFSASFGVQLYSLFDVIAQRGFVDVLQCAHPNIFRDFTDAFQ
jgi:hypothetical protein